MATIEERLKAIEEKLGIEQKPVAGWYRFEQTPEYLMFIDPVKKINYGFSSTGKWVEKDNWTYNFDLSQSCYMFYELADPKEVEQRMELMLKDKYPQFKNFSYHADEFSSYFNKGYGWNELGDEEVLLIDNGVFKEIIEEPLTINGKEVIVKNKDVIIIDGIEYGLGFFKNFIDDCDQLGVTKVFSSVMNTTTIEDLKQLLTKIEERENK